MSLFIVVAVYLARFPVEGCESVVDGLDEGELSLAADVVDVVSIDGVEGNAGQVAEDGVFGLRKI